MSSIKYNDILEISDATLISALPMANTNSDIGINDEPRPTLRSLGSNKSIPSTKTQSTPVHSDQYYKLPKNVLVKIFAHFSEVELTSVLAPVCRDWRSATRDASLWKNLTFEGSGVSAETICKMLRNAPQLQRLKLVAVADIVAVIRQVCRCNPQIKHLEVKNCIVTGNKTCLPEMVMKNLVLSCKQIEYLDLDGTHFITKRFVHDVVRLPNLRSINLSNNQNLRVKDLITLSFNCRTLEELQIGIRRTLPGQQPLTDADANIIFANFAGLLKSLKFDLRGLGSASYEAIFKCSNLEKLCLNNAFYLNGDLFQRLDEFLPNLETLKIGNAAQLTADDFRNLFLPNKPKKHLRSLKLFSCWKLNDDALVSIVDCCAESLEFLSVRSCKLLTNRSIEYAMKNCHKLRYLDIAHVIKLTDSRCLTDILANIPHHLQILIVGKDVKNEGSLLQLKSLMPKIKIKFSLSDLYKMKSICLD